MRRQTSRKVVESTSGMYDGFRLGSMLDAAFAVVMAVVMIASPRGNRILAIPAASGVGRAGCAVAIG